MITGSVLNRHILMPVTFCLSGQPDFAVDFVVDTGYTGFLTLPSQAVAAMRLPFLHNTLANLADDSAVEIAVHAATIVWHGRVFTVRVLATGKRPLLETALIDGDELFAQFGDAGLATVNRI